MRITYIANVRIPTERAQGVQVMHTCEALAKAGAEVELVVPFRFNALKADPYEYYAIERNFKITRVFSLDLVWAGKVGFLMQQWSFARAAKKFIRRNKTDVVYVRGEQIFEKLISLADSVPMFLETHMKPKDMDRLVPVYKKARGVVVITKYYLDELRRLGIRAAIAPDGVTISDFDIDISRDEARQKLGLPLNKKIAMYTGHLYAWKGADTLAKAAAFLPNEILVTFVGGSPEDLKPFKERYKGAENIFYAGLRPYKEIPTYLRAADVLILPNTAKEEISKHYTSPVKLFEYMASSRPIIASDLPSIRDVLNEKNSILVPPDEPRALAQAIVRATTLNVSHIALESRKNVEAYSWQERAAKILDFLKSSL